MTAPTGKAPLFLAAAAAFVLALGTTGSALAKEVEIVGDPTPPDSISEFVSFDDLNLLSSAGADRLHHRVRSAVKRVCRPLEDRRTYREHIECRNFAWNGAAPQLNLALARARQMAANGRSAIAPVAILVRAPALRGPANRPDRRKAPGPGRR